MIDPVEAFKMATSSLLVPTSTSSFSSSSSSSSSSLPIPSPTGSVSPIPTVIAPTIEKIGDSGIQTLWVVFVIMLLSSLVFMFLSFRIPVQKRLFHVITTLITTFATISYFAMATGDGYSFTEVLVKHTYKRTPDFVEHILRQVFWARHVDRSLTTPLILLDLAFLGGMNGADILVAIVADLIMVLLSLFGALGSTEGQKWGYYAMACIAYLVVVYQFVVSGRRAVLTKDKGTAKLFASIGGFTLIVWTLYPIVWGIGEGARKWSVDAEIIAYAVLDVLAIPVFGFWLLFAHSNKVNIEGFWSYGLAGEGAIRIDDDEGS
ncbi:hypothetical protein B7494_g4922 [Chlorociboria aeruginascens]|nr:hypothetical protein B7494_g4922 [Chlorociboria aeruginascens]